MVLHSELLWATALTAATTVGCSEDFHPETNPDAQGTIAGVPPCLEGELAVAGQLDGASAQASVFGLSPAQADPGAGARGYFQLREGGNAVVRIEMEQVPARGTTVPALGWVDLAAHGGPAAGQCDTGSLEGRYALSADGAVHTFSLINLHALPPCSGASLSGELKGCYRDESVH